jgi:hypothetical protein
VLKGFSRTFAVLAAAAGIIGAATVLSGASEKTSVTVSLKTGKGDRLDIRAVGPGCSRQAWPYYEAACVKDRRHAASQARPVRIVTADRLPAGR